MISPQPSVPTSGEAYFRHGNQWFGVPDISAFNSYNAWYDGDPFLMLTSKFTVHTNATPYHPVRIQAPQNGWFEVDEGDFFDCNDFFAPEIPEEDIVRKAVAERKISGAGYGEGSQWIASRKLFSELYNNPSLITPGAVADFYANHQTTPVGGFNGVGEGIGAMYSLDAPTIGQMEGLHYQLAQYMDELAAIDQQLVTANESQIPGLLATRAGLLQQLAPVGEALVVLSDGIAADRQSASGQVMADNAAVGATEVYENNLQTVNDILLRTVVQGEVDFDATDLAQLTIIASQCPEDGGDGVYLARALLGTAAPVNGNCGGQSAWENPNRHHVLFVEGEAAFLLYPNPTDGDINLVFPETTEGEVAFSLLDLNGKQVLNLPLAEGQNHRIGLNGLAGGMYFYKIVRDKELLQAGKVLITD